jgi:phage tail-like protein
MDSVRWKRINTENLFRLYGAMPEEGAAPTGELSENIEIRKTGFRIRTTHRYADAITVHVPGTLSIRDLIIDECNRVYVLSRDRLLMFRRDSGSFEYPVYGTAGNPPTVFTDGRAIGIDEDTLYIADNAVDPDDAKQTIRGRIIALARCNLQVRWILQTGPDHSRFIHEVVDLEISGKTILFIEKDKNCGIVHTIGRDGEYVSSTTLDSDIVEPTDIARTVPGAFAILSKDGVDFFESDIKTGRYFRKTPKTRLLFPGGTSVPGGLVYIPDGQVIAGANDAPYRNELLPSLSLLRNRDSPNPEYLWSYRGYVSRLVLDPDNNLYVIDDEGKNICILQYLEAVNAAADDKTCGTYVSRPIDSTERETRWHRFIIEGNFPAGTRVDFQYAVSETENDNPVWLPGICGNSVQQGTEMRDWLFLGADEGRYLRFKVILSGTDTLTPEVSSVTLVFPRVTWLEYLPEIYRRDPAGKDFAERFISLFESSFTEMESAIEQIGRLLDPVGTPDEFVDWLGSWLAVISEKDCPVDRKRRFLLHAMEIYQKRGTRAGLAEAIRVYSGVRPDIIEYCTWQDALKCTVINDPLDEKHLYLPSDDAVVECGVFSDDEGKPSEENTRTETVMLKEILFGSTTPAKDACRSGFCVLLRNNPPVDDAMLASIRKIIECEKPAHAPGGLIRLEPRFYLDMHTYLGVNTTLARMDFIIGSHSVISRDTVIGDVECSAQLRIRSRIGIDTKLT